MDDGTASSPANSAPGPTKARYLRAGRGLEFDRVVNFSDAVFAIALTLTAVALAPPALDHERDAANLLEKLGAMSDELIVFFVVFAVMGSYWLANHRFVAQLGGIDAAYVVWTLPYLAVIAFLPFPAELMGRYFENPAAVAFFALNMALVSLFEWVLLWRAYESALFLRPLTRAGFRWASLGSLAPVVVFVASVPVMWIDTVLGLVVWALNMPVGAYINRHAPALRGDDRPGTTS